MKSWILTITIAFQFFTLKSQNVTWSEDIACLIYTHCSPCHNSNAVAEFPLMSYDDVYNERLAVEIFVNTKKMPPSLPNSHYRNFSENRSLSENEIELIKLWARDMAYRGDESKEPSPPVFIKPKSTLVNPDIAFITSYQLPDSIVGHIRRNFVIPQSIYSTKKIKAIEIVPSEAAIIHSVFIYADTSLIPLSKDVADNDAGYDQFFGTGSTNSKPLYGWMVGSSPFYLPENLTLKVDSGSYIIVQVQYSDEGAGYYDSTLINISFDTSSNTRLAETKPLLSQNNSLVNGPFVLPVDSTFIFHEIYPVTENISLLNISPNVHYFCDNLKVFATTPLNDTIKLLSIEDWDPTWTHGTYYFKNPIYIPQGSVINAFATFSNTPLNQHESGDSLQTVFDGVGEDDEEMVFNFTYLPYLIGDKNIDLDSIAHFKHYTDCKPIHTVSNKKEFKKNEFGIFPNPASKYITITGINLSPSVTIEIYNSLGQLCMTDIIIQQDKNIDISSLMSGIYFIRIESFNNTEAKKFLIVN